MFTSIQILVRLSTSEYISWSFFVAPKAPKHGIILSDWFYELGLYLGRVLIPVEEDDDG